MLKLLLMMMMMRANGKWRASWHVQSSCLPYQLRLNCLEGGSGCFALSNILFFSLQKGSRRNTTLQLHCACAQVSPISNQHFKDPSSVYIRPLCRPPLSYGQWPSEAGTIWNQLRTMPRSGLMLRSLRPTQTPTCSAACLPDQPHFAPETHKAGPPCFPWEKLLNASRRRSELDFFLVLGVPVFIEHDGRPACHEPNEKIDLSRNKAWLPGRLPRDEQAPMRRSRRTQATLPFAKTLRP